MFRIEFDVLSDGSEFQVWASEEPKQDQTRAEGVEEYVCEEEGWAMREERLSCLHGDAVASGEGNDYRGVFEAWQLPVVGGVGERSREGEVHDDVSPVGGLDEFETEVVDGGFEDGDERAIEDDCSDDGDSGVTEKA